MPCTQFVYSCQSFVGMIESFRLGLKLSDVASPALQFMLGAVAQQDPSRGGSRCRSAWDNGCCSSWCRCDSSSCSISWRIGNWNWASQSCCFIMMALPLQRGLPRLLCSGLQHSQLQFSAANVCGDGVKQRGTLLAYVATRSFENLSLACPLVPSAHEQHAV